MGNKILNYILGVLLILSIGLNIYLGISLKNSQIEIVHETVYVKDTVVRDSIQIQEKVRTVFKTQFDTAIILKRDTIQDTLYVELPIEHKQYKETINKDSIIYDVQIDYSGFHPSLDRIEVGSNFVRQEIKVEKDKPWRFGVMIGPYIGYGGQINPTTKVVTAGPEIGIGIQVGWGYTFKTK